MSEANNKTIAKNTVFLYLRMLVLMLVSFYTTRVLLKALGVDDYGIFNVVGSLIVMISFINQGLLGASRRYIIAELTTGDLHSQREMYTNVVYSHLIICVVILFLGETIGLWFFSNYLNIPEDRYNAAMWVYQFSLITSLATIMLSPFNAVIVSEEKMSAYAFFSIIDAGMKLAIVWILMVINGDKLITYALLLVGVGLVDFVIYYFYCRVHFPLCRLVRIKGLQKLKELFKYMGWSVFGLGSNVASRQGVTMLVNIFFSVAVNAAMGISNMISGVATQFVNNFQMAFTPQLTKNYIAGNNGDVINLVDRASRYSSLLVLIMLIPIGIVISDLLEIWLGEYPQYTEEFCVLTLICIYFDAMSNSLTTVITADKKIRNYQLLVGLLYLMDFGICWLVLVFGALPYSVILVRLGISLAGMGLRLFLMKKRVFGFSSGCWIKSVLGRGFVIVLLCSPLIVFNFFDLFGKNIYLRFFIVGIVSIAWTMFVIWLIGLTTKERCFVINKVRAFINKQ